MNHGGGFVGSVVGRYTSLGRRIFVRMVLLSACLGSLLGIFVWAVRDGLDAHEGQTWYVEGPVTVLRFVRTPAGGDDALARAELLQFLSDHNLSVLAAPSGDGLPGIWAFDPRGRIPWLSGSGYPPTATPTDRAVVLLQGSYSAEKWTRFAVKTPFLPADSPVLGLIEGPAGAGALQFVGPLGLEALMPGDYVISSTDRSTIQEFVRFMTSLGLLPVSVSQRGQLGVLLQEQPVVVVLAALVTVAGAVFVGYWWMFLSARQRFDLGIRIKHGASPWRLTGSLLRKGLPAALVGTCAGVVGVSSIGHLVAAPPPITVVDLLGQGPVVAAVWLAASLLWFVAIRLYVRTRYEVDLAA